MIIIYYRSLFRMCEEEASLIAIGLPDLVTVTEGRPLEISVTVTKGDYFNFSSKNRYNC